MLGRGLLCTVTGPFQAEVTSRLAGALDGLVDRRFSFRGSQQLLRSGGVPWDSLHTDSSFVTGPTPFGPLPGLLL